MHTTYATPSAATPAALLASMRGRAANVNPAQLEIQLEHAREQEREHLAREFHDVLGGLLTAARLDVASLQSLLAGQSDDIDRRLGHLNDTLRATFALKRRIIDGLAPASLPGVGLQASLELMAREFVESTGVRLSTGLDDVAVDEAMQLAIYRLVQESLTNIAKYAAAPAAEILLRNDCNGITVTVRDDGRGFDVAQPRAHGHGLDGMRHRIESAGGQLVVESSPGRGTTIRATFPTPLLRAAGPAH